MCGIAGVLDLNAATSEADLSVAVERMADALSHRGPDDKGVWVDPSCGLALGHRRLSIIDLSPLGHQPMVSASGRYVLAYNGEAYNFRQLRKQLESAGHQFRGNSDTEVLLGCVEAWGVYGALSRLNGMFALALWDRAERELHLARDRMGEKPLYYGWFGRVLLFGSELKALRAHPAFSGQIDRSALALYLRHNCVPSPHSIYQGVRKLAPGSWLRLSLERPFDAAPVRYWSLQEVAEAGSANPNRHDRGQLTDELEALLTEAVALRMESDVPLGALLSGGVDSSLVVALMQQVARGRVRTFTVGFDDPAYDESGDAAAVAAHLGTDHTELRLSADELLETVPLLPTLYDEPFGDSSQLPTYLVSRLARSQVTVALSGDGGDELFGGYNRYVWCPAIWHRMGHVPVSLRRAGARALGVVSPARWDRLFQMADPLLPRRLRVRNPGSKVQKLADVLPADSVDDMYRLLTSHWQDPASLVLGAEEAPSLLAAANGRTRLADPVDRMMFLDAVTYLPDDILVKLDRASMGVSLEARAPLLDHRVVEFAWSLPLDLKLRDGQGKWLLRQVLYRHVPAELIERPKMGFGLPIGNWLKGPLRDWAEDLLNAHRLRAEGYFEPGPIRASWERHLTGRRDAEHQLWDVLMFQSWLEGVSAPQAVRAS